MRTAATLLLVAALWAGWARAQQPPAGAPTSSPAAPALLVEEPPPGHVEIMLSGSRGAALDTAALAPFLDVLRAPGFLDSSALSTADPLAPCALLSALTVSSELNYVFGALIFPGRFDLRLPKGTNILGRYDADLARLNAALARDDSSKAADMVARIVIWRSWGWSTQLNQLLTQLNQRQCLEMLVEPARLPQALPKLPPVPVMTHGAPASAYITSVSRDLGNDWLAALPRAGMLGLSSRPTGNPLMPCELLSAFRMASRLNESWGQFPKGKFDTEGRPDLTPYAEALKKPLGIGSVEEPTAELFAAVIAAEIVRSRWLSAQLLEGATQGECLVEMFQPGGLRAKLERAGTTLPRR